MALSWLQRLLKQTRPARPLGRPARFLPQIELLGERVMPAVTALFSAPAMQLRIIGDDRPGLLATVSAAIGALGGNILEVAHNRLALDVPAKGAEFDIMIETPVTGPRPPRCGGRSARRGRRRSCSRR